MFWLSCREQKKIFDLKEQGGAHGGAEGKVWDGLGKPFDQTEQRGGKLMGSRGGGELWGRAWEALWLYVLRSCFLGFLAESPDDMQQTVGRDDVVECLRASLSVDVSSDVGEIAQNVESVEEEGEVALGYAFR